LIECSIYIPGTEEVFSYENGEVNISHRYAYQQHSYEAEEKVKEEVEELEEESEEESLPLLFQKKFNIKKIYNFNNKQIYNQTTISLNPAKTTINNQTITKYMTNKEFGYVSSDYYLKGAFSFGGDGAERITPTTHLYDGRNGGRLE